MRLLSLLTVLLSAASVHGWAGVAIRDAAGRVFANAGTRPDSVLVDGKVFATGFHNIQGLAFHGKDLWVSNSPDLTVVRDRDGDNRADDYMLMARRLGDEVHGLHGIAWGADGRLYLATDELALMPPRELGRPIVFHQGEYAPQPFTPPAGLAHEQGVLCCDADGRWLHVVARGPGLPMQPGFDDAFRLGQGNQAPAALPEDEKRHRPLDQWSFEELAADLGCSNDAACVAAGEELVRRGESIKAGMLVWLRRMDLSQRQCTWALWTLGRAGKDDVEIESWFPAQLKASQDANTRVQCLRIIAFRMKEFGFAKELPAAVKEALQDDSPEVRKQAEEVLNEKR